MHIQQWGNEAVSTLNELSGAPFSEIPPAPLNLGQESCMDRLKNIFDSLPPPDSGLTPAGACIELCGSATRYDPILSASVAPYDKDLVSWPPQGSEPAPVLESLGGADFATVNGWETHILMRPKGVLVIAPTLVVSDRSSSLRSSESLLYMPISFFGFIRPACCLFVSVVTHC